MPGVHDPNAIECFNSFGSTGSETKNCSEMSDAEVGSRLRGRGCFSSVHLSVDFDGTFRVRVQQRFDVILSEEGVQASPHATLQNDVLLNSVDQDRCPSH
ncbi:hypothetical protein MLD38_027396 [Melastoma candidum]|uniref:Uncharacterized protein n=1 Tax=Melastoma candidum TaxID=119954 RepID=A0ACB9P1G7_9MYRT|nr:hypothetical protein MLD38_027396 [Melastoma candidum]